MLLPFPVFYSMSWLQKIAQIPATNLSAQLWYHGTDSLTAYNLTHDMTLRPREETDNTSYSGSLSSVPTNVYLTSAVGKAAKHAIERAEFTGGHPVILVIQPESLGAAYIDEDFVHMMLTGNDYFHEQDWYPSPLLEKEIFEIAANELNVDVYDNSKSDKELVLEYLRNINEWDSNDLIEDEYLKEEGIVPNEHGDYEYDPSMHLAKYIASVLNDKNQKEAINNFRSMAHAGKVEAAEIYMIPWRIQRPTDEGTTWEDFPTSMKSHEELQQFGTPVDPNQLLMPFMRGK